uniref:Uncharacterized protein n=1 Tax=Plectus sambesii TaxID=2011161 RepID=A0A914WME9_9BILA
MLIIANENFDTLKPNTGALVDQKTVERLGEILGYDVKSSHRDLTAEQMRQELKKFVEKIKTEPYVASAIVFVLSHGGPHEIYGVDGNTIKRQEIFDALKADKCGALKGKPKLIFFDACRGDKHDPGAVNKGKSAEHQKRSDSHKDRTYTPDERSAALAEHEIVKAIAYTEEQEKELETKGPRLSIMSDMLIVDATAMDYYAYGTSKGSHFINAISQIFESNFETKSIDEMLHMVHDHVLEIMQEGRKEDEYHSVEGTNYQSSFRKKFMFCPPSAN